MPTTTAWSRSYGSRVSCSWGRIFSPFILSTSAANTFSGAAVESIQLACTHHAKRPQVTQRENPGHDNTKSTWSEARQCNIHTCKSVYANAGICTRHISEHTANVNQKECKSRVEINERVNVADGGEREREREREATKMESLSEHSAFRGLCV